MMNMVMAVVMGMVRAWLERGRVCFYCIIEPEGAEITAYTFDGMRSIAGFFSLLCYFRCIGSLRLKSQNHALWRDLR